MNPAMLSMLGRKGLTIAGAVIVGAWSALEYPETWRSVFGSSVFALVSALGALLISGKLSFDKVKKP